MRKFRGTEESWKTKKSWKNETSNTFGVYADIRNVHLIWKDGMVENVGGVEQSQRNVKHEQLVVYIHIYFFFAQ